MSKNFFLLSILPPPMAMNYRWQEFEKSLPIGTRVNVSSRSEEPVGWKQKFNVLPSPGLELMILCSIFHSSHHTASSQIFFPRSGFFGPINFSPCVRRTKIWELASLNPHPLLFFPRIIYSPYLSRSRQWQLTFSPSISAAELTTTGVFSWQTFPLPPSLLLRWWSW